MGQMHTKLKHVKISYGKKVKKCTNPQMFLFFIGKCFFIFQEIRYIIF